MYDRLLKLLSENQGELSFPDPNAEAAKKARAEKARRIALGVARGQIPARAKPPEGIQTEPSEAQRKAKKDFKSAAANDND